MAGRKKKPGKRHNCGKLVQGQFDTEKPDTVAVEARMRLLGISREKAKQQETGTAIGRRIGPGGINIDQHEVLVEANIAHRNYLWAINVGQQRSASDFSGAGGYDGNEGTDPEYIERCRRDVRKWKEKRRWILDASPLAMMAFETWVIEDKEAWSLLGELRLAANALIRLRKLDKAA